MDGNIAYMSALQAAGAIKAGRISSRQAVEAVLHKIDEHNREINAVVTLDRDGALRQADNTDSMQKADAADKPLWGVPVTIKDIFKTARDPFHRQP